MTDTLVFVDACLLLAAVDDHDPSRRDRARHWLRHAWTTRTGRSSVQVLNEFYMQARRRFASPLTAGDARAEVRRYQHWRPWQIDHPTVETAWAIESRYGLAYADALVVASAQQQGCRVLLTDTLADGAQVDAVKVIDPFRSGPESLCAAAATDAPLASPGALPR